MNPSTLLTFADDLSIYLLDDIERALMAIASIPRRDGETAFPDIATIMEAIRNVKRGRNERHAIDTLNEKIAHFKANPELYCTPAEVSELAKKLEEKFSFQAPREIRSQQYREETCPHCREHLPVAINMRFCSSQELRNLADVMEKNEQTTAADKAV